MRLAELLERLDRWQTPDGLDTEPRRIASSYIRFSGKLSLSKAKMERGRAAYEVARAQGCGLVEAIRRANTAIGVR